VKADPGFGKYLVTLYQLEDRENKKLCDQEQQEKKEKGGQCSLLAPLRNAHSFVPHHAPCFAKVRPRIQMRQNPNQTVSPKK
jgi:hypothetical protein